MKKLLALGAFVALALSAVALGAASALAAEGMPPITVTVANVTQADVGTCNNNWAQDTFDKIFTLSANTDGTYNLRVNYKQGTFSDLPWEKPGSLRKWQRQRQHGRRWRYGQNTSGVQRNRDGDSRSQPESQLRAKQHCLHGFEFVPQRGLRRRELVEN